MLTLYICTVLGKANFKVLYAAYSSVQHYLRVRILGIVSIREVLLGTRHFLRDGCICYRIV